jgi:hypothetical protein
MARPKRWYDPDAASALRLVPRADQEDSWSVMKWRHPRVSPSLRECLAYPLSDGPGLGLLFFLPPMLWVLSLPVFDVISYLQPMKADWALGMLIVPIMTPMIFSFAMTFGYALLFLGHMLVSSALGENDHPRWPEWQPSEIAEGIGRWFWAGMFGIALGGIPLVYYRMHCGEIDWFDLVVFLNLIALAVGYAQMAWAAALLHDNIIAANPVTVFLAIFRIGWDYLRPCLVAVLVIVLAGSAAWGLIYRMPNMWMEGLAIWLFWVLIFYGAMVMVRMMGLTYHAHALDLHWFRRRPRWTSSGRKGQIYAKS